MRDLKCCRKVMLIVAVFFTFLSCEKDDGSEEFKQETKAVSYEEYSDDPLVTFLVDPKEATSVAYKNNIHKTLNYSKIPFTAINLERYNESPNFGVNNQVVIITDPERLNDKGFSLLLNFLDKGGMVLLPIISSGEKFDFLAGIKKNSNRQTDMESEGYLSKDNILPDFKNKGFKPGTILYGLSGENFSSEIEVLATAINNSEYPAILQNNLGNGKVILMNTSQAFEKRDRGLIFSILLQGLEGVPYSVANTSSIFLDDFPAPLYNMKMEPVHTEMSVTQSQFYTDHWWPDMLKLGKDEGLKYSAYVCFDYRNLTSPPFTFEEWELSKKRENGKTVMASDWLMKAISSSEHEMAFHGYNHASLIDNAWPNHDFMVLGLEAAKKRWKLKNYGKLPISYVPPSNTIDSMGFVALKKVFPSVKYNASLYLGDFKEGGNREFDAEPYNDHFFNFPRITSGYVMDVANQYNQQNLFLYTGIWSHFIHADDIYQIPSNLENDATIYEYRNEMQLGWKRSADGSKGLFTHFESYIKQTRKLYPMMRFLAVKDAAEITEKWRKASYSYNFEKDKIGATLSMEDANWWFVYVSDRNKAMIEKSFKVSSYNFSRTALHEGNLYMVKTPAGSIALSRISKSLPESKISLSEQFSNYLVLNKEPEQKDVSEKILQLKGSLRNSRAFTESSWLELFQYLSWDNSQAEIWPLLKQQYEKSTRDSRYVNLAYKLVKGSDYPNLETRKFWMKENILILNELKAKQEYIGYFGEQDEVKLNASELMQLITATDSEGKFIYTEMLLKRYPNEAISFFDNIEACGNYQNSAELISWFYAEKHKYEKAISWSSCIKSIDKETIDQWYLKTGKLEKIKERDNILYVSWLLGNTPLKATEELVSVNPCASEFRPIASDISYAFGNQGSYRKAISWSECVLDFPILTKMHWHAQLQQTREIEALYVNTNATNENFDEIQNFLVSYYISIKDLEKAWKLADNMAESTKKKELRKQFNKDVQYMDRKIQKELLLKTPNLFDTEVAATIKKDIRTTESDFLILNGKLVADRLDPNYYEAKIGYGLRDAKLNTHIFSIVKNQAYEVPVAQAAPNNIDRSLFGVDYQFQSAIKPKKFNYSVGGRLELDSEENVFYHVRAGATLSIDSLYSSASFFRRPALTGGAYGLNIYQSQLNIYEELRINKTFRSTLYLEGNHYDDDDTVDATLAFAFFGKIFKNGGSTVSGFTEVAGLLGNRDKSSGYPYWTLKERLYGGLGTGYSFEIPKKDISLNLDAAYFLDTFSDNFQRYRGSFSFPFYDKLYFTGNLEFYTLKNFYSNNFGVGLRYYLN